MISAIIFDFFGVICTDVYWTWLKKTVPDLLVKKDFFQSLSDEIDKGTITPAEFIKTLSEKTGVPERDVDPQMMQGLGVDKDLVNLIKLLKPNYKIGLLTNSNTYFTDKILSENGLTPLFDTISISEKVGFIKPQREIFDITIKNLGVSPSETIFIDDRQVHVQAAERIGIKGILYQDARQLKGDLSKLGINFFSQ